MHPLQRHQLAYDGRVSQLYGICALNLVLKILTLGIYSFWGKTRLRRYLIGSCSLAGDRFAYTGTGGELFRGFLRALPIVIVLYAPIIIWEPAVYPLTNLMFIPILFAVFAGIYAALRYRYSRITWRGIRGKLTGSAWAYARLVIGRTILNLLTLGLLVPWSDAKTQGYIIEHSYFGSAKADFRPDPSKLMKINIITLLLAVVTFGLSRFWYAAARNRHFYASTHIAGLQLECTHTGGKLLRMLLVDLLILACTFGLGLPFIIQRHVKFFIQTLTIIGDIDTISIRQAEGTHVTSGEGLDAMLGEQDFGFA